jgi:hypothetical protein
VHFISRFLFVQQQAWQTTRGNLHLEGASQHHCFYARASERGGSFQYGALAQSSRPMKREDLNKIFLLFPSQSLQNYCIFKMKQRECFHNFSSTKLE